MAESKGKLWYVAHGGSIYYISTATGKYREARSREIINDLPAMGVIDGVSGPNWVITEGYVLPYKGEITPGHLLPKDEMPAAAESDVVRTTPGEEPPIIPPGAAPPAPAVVFVPDAPAEEKP